MTIEGVDSYGISSLVDFFLTLENPDNILSFVIGIFLITVITITREVFIYKKSPSKKLNPSSVTLKIILSIAVGYILLLTFRTPVMMLFAVLASTPLSEWIFNKYFKEIFDNSNDEAQNEMVEDPVSVDEMAVPPLIDELILEEPPEELIAEEISDTSSEETIQVEDGLRNPDLDNIIDLLVVYNYISLNQRRRLFEETLLISDPEKEIERLLEMPIITRDELDEIKAIRQLIKLEGRLVTKEEATKWLTSVRNRRLQRDNVGSDEEKVQRRVRKVRKVGK